MQAAATTRESKGSGSGSGSDRRRRSDRQLVTLPLEPPKSRKKGKSRRSSPTPPPAPPPGMLISGADGHTYAPLGYYPPQSGASRNSPTRPRSATSQQLRGAPPQYGYPQGSSGRHYSDGGRPTSSSSTASRRPLPDEEDWEPVNSRRGSASSQPVDPFEFQVDSGHPPPIPQQYMQGRRNVSGPAEVAYSSVRRSPPLGQHAYPSMSRGSSDPTLRRQSSRRDEIEVESLTDSSDDEDDQSDDLGNGVQVFVEDERAEKALTRKPIGSRKKGKGR